MIELIDCCQIYRQGINLAAHGRQHPMPVIIKIGEGLYIAPDSLVRRVKNMRSVLVDVDVGFGIIAGVTVSADVIAFFDNQDFFTGFFYFMGENSTEKTGSDYNEIIHR